MNDKDIIQLYLNRDQRALSATAKKYGKYCTSIAKNILGNNEDAEELHIPQELRIRSRGTERHSASD